jgi:nucleoside-diphosphate-sugar epimerase
MSVSSRGGEGVLVTGATGFIGRHLVAALDEAGWKVYPWSQRQGHIARCPFPVDNVRHVFHLAARTFVPDSWQDPRPYYDVNVLGTVNVLEFCRRSSAALTFVSSYVYGRPSALPIAETHPLQAFNPYGHTKILAESVVDFYRAAFGVKASIVRPFNVYGPGQSEHFLVPKVIRQALDPGVDVILVGDLRPRRDYLYVSDLVSLLMKTLHAGGGGVYNAGTGRSRSVEWVVDTVREIAAAGKPVRSTAEPRASEVLDVVADVTRVARDLQWEPTVRMEDGLARTVTWMRTEFAGRP